MSWDTQVILIYELFGCRWLYNVWYRAAKGLSFPSPSETINFGTYIQLKEMATTTTGPNKLSSSTSVTALTGPWCCCGSVIAFTHISVGIFSPKRLPQ